MSKIYYIYDRNLSGQDYNQVDAEAISKNIWSDSVGHHFTKSANSAINCFNMEHEKVWEKLEPLLNISEDEITYNSEEYEINALWID